MILHYRSDKIPVMSTERTIAIEAIGGKEHPGIAIRELETKTSKYSSLIDLTDGLGHKKFWRDLKGLTGMIFMGTGGFALFSDVNTTIDNTTLDDPINALFHLGTLTAGVFLFKSALKSYESIRRIKRQINKASINFPQE